MINEFGAKKLGEVLAFAVVGIETFEKGHEALAKVLGEEEVKKLIAGSSKHRESIWEIVKQENIGEIVQKKLDGTGDKLRAMRDLYVGDQWDNATELLEWSGFFEGAAVVHWSLVRGVGEATGHPDVIGLAGGAFALHQEILNMATEKLHELGKERAH